MSEGRERVDALCEGLRVIQRTDAFQFGTDSVLLADFASPKRRDHVVELGAGCGVICFLMASRQPDCTFEAIELQPEIAEMMRRSVAMNALEARIRVHTADLRDGAALLGRGSATLVVCNPPYGKAGATIGNENERCRTARHELDATIEDVSRAASELLRCGGRFAVVFPAPRLLELMCAMRAAKLEPKRVRTVHARADRAPKLALVEAVKLGGSQLHWLPPLILAKEDGTPTEAWKQIYRIEE